MKLKLNSVKNLKLIKIIDCCEFCFIEEPLKIASPVSEYYFKTDDLSINLRIKLKWVLYGFFFFKSLSLKIEDVEEDYKNGTYFSNSINSNFTYSKVEHVLILDDLIIANEIDFIQIVDNNYNNFLYDENSVICLKLKVNVVEFIILQNTAFPRIVFYD